jgi:hypothetical protein
MIFSWKHRNNLKLWLYIICPFLIIISAIAIYISISSYKFYTKEIEASQQNYIGISIMDDNGNVLQSRDISVSGGNQFSGKLNVKNFISSDREYIVKIYRGDSFISFMMNNILSEEHIVKLRKGQEEVYDLVLKDSLDLDGQDYTLMFFVNKESSPMGKYGKFLYASRFRIIDDNESNIVANYKKDNIQIDKYLSSNYNTDFGYCVSNEIIDKDTKSVKVISNINSKSKVTLYINIPNKTENPIQYKLIYLKNWKTNKILDKDYLLFTLADGKTATIPIELTFSKDDIGKNIVFLLVPSPFEAMGDENLKILGEKNISITIETSDKILIN